ncbi:Nuclear polyadenylated RNA-binding protein NAB2 OS=Saccharomyces cerevisiae (strain ATCC 204508 / S288c) GN=NAB2 PE=1 SV=1 [Rhizoctonia solani AG-1 IB]|uniref:Nuclear polyadenylated RNA-binding protein NAB2 n=2 Tax=Thanatephorus cucumeris (strain AG1-IB / isolate 7/3/14) TaxID=1108050 RepID=A0A0B7FKA1_THACB|nr:Nuclear polyadenylated RNA-binding protein NAB2 OS=Saccharomyces cerevisiae (strain ATCC 204508 / S288c) GN=NAB2 PE=1 SV=1 [Rhizoctonia solani AG-1 IB]
MGSDLVMGTPQAAALQSAIQKELVAKGYSDESDMVMAEYITIMLINSKTAEQITAELVDLVGPEYDTSFTSWLFEEIARISGSGTGGSNEVQPSVLDAQSTSTSNQASSEAVGAPSPGNKRRADGRSPSPASKSRRTTDLPDRPRAMRDGQSNNEPQPVRSLLDRVEPREPRRHGGNGFDHVQAQIDSVTRGGHHGGRMMGGRGGGMGMNGHHHQQQQQQQMMMNPMMGGVNPMMFQEIMANQMALMSQMAANMGMIQGGPPMMAPGAPGFGFPNGHGQGPHVNGRGRGRGGRGGNMGDRPPVGGPQQGSSQSHQPSQQQPPQQVQAQAIASPQPRPSQPAVPLNIPTRPQSPTLCKFGIKCTNAACRYSHPSAEGGLVLSSEYCEKGLECKDADCTKGHPSPAAINGVPVQASAPQPRSNAPTGGIPCKFGAACTRPGCAFVHPQKGGKPCRFGINCTRADCTFDHPPGRVLPGSAPQKSAHKSMTFRANAPGTAMQSGPVSKKFGPGGVPVANADGTKKTESENGGDEEDVEAALVGA